MCYELLDHVVIGGLPKITGGVEDTKKYVAKFGRAKSLLERAIGHQDAGATSVWLIFQGMREYVEDKME